MSKDRDIKLAAWALDELSDKDREALTKELGDDLDGHLSLMQDTVKGLRAMPHNDAPDEVVDRVVASAKPRGRLFSLSNLVKVAASVAVVGLCVGALIWANDDDPKPTEYVATVITAKGERSIRDGELVKAGLGSPVGVTSDAMDIGLDSSAALSVTKDAMTLDRGRAIVRAKQPTSLKLANGDSIELVAGGVISVDYDVAYANVTVDGKTVEIQRQPLSMIPMIAKTAWGVEWKDDLPREIGNMRVSIFARDMNSDEFQIAINHAAAKYGVSVNDNTMTYTKTSGRITGLADMRLELIALDQSATFKGQTVNAGQRLVLETGREPQIASAKDTQTSRLTAWTVGMKDDPWAKYRVQEPENGQSLPSGTVIYADRLSVGRTVYRLDGEYDFPLPNGQNGRVVDITGSAITVETKSGDRIRMALTQ